MRSRIFFVFLAIAISGCVGAPTREGVYTENPVPRLDQDCPEGTTLVEYVLPKGDHDWETERISQYCLDSYGLEQGPGRSWDDGRLEEKGQYANGKRVGEWTQYFSDGKFMVSSFNQYGEREGLERGYYKSGQLEYVREFTRGLENGPVIWHFPNGMIREYASFYAGQLHGLSVAFAQDGAIRSESEYDHHKLIREYNPLSVSTFVTSNGDGYVERHNPHGQLVVHGHFENGIPHGCWERLVDLSYSVTTLFHQGKVIAYDCDPQVVN